MRDGNLNDMINQESLQPQGQEALLATLLFIDDEPNIY